jgi:ATP-dependent Lhr-like helicase
MVPTGSLDIFHENTKRWFERTLGTPTAVQEAAWPAIASGEHTLVSAPTGTGKTLAAFLVFIDRLVEMARRGSLKQELYLIYVSPLRSLARDIRENLRKPLEGLLKEADRSGGFLWEEKSGLSVKVRTGDTPQSERRRMTKSPPHILITTPESLFLMLTGKSGQSVLRTARWVIFDEVHAMIDSKRGAHLSLSLARLDKLCPKPLQRIGLSATIEPLDEAARWLSPEPVTIAAPKMHKEVELVVTSPTFEKAPKKDAAWQEIAESVYRYCREARSVIAFVDGRAYAEKLAYYVNQLGGEGFAKTHHGSISREQRLEVEQALRRSELRLLCATSSMELGIDVGEIDQVFQIGCPRSISGAIQRLGRSGHNPNRVSVMRIFARAPGEALYSGIAAEVVRRGGIEKCRPPRLCLDVLAQHLVSMATGDGYTLDEVMEILLRAYPFRDVTKEDVKSVLRMLAGDYEHDRDIPVRPRVLYDRIHERVEGDTYSRMLAVSAGGTIPDKGLYAVRTEDGVKVGELDEEFVFEAREGDRFLLGSFAWQITDIRKDTVVVRQSSTTGARPPFWKGEIKGRRIETGFAYGEILRDLERAYKAGSLLQALSRLGLDEKAAESAEGFINKQLAATRALPDDRTIIIEHFRDETGAHQMMVHSVFGRPVNEPLAILVTQAAERLLKANINYVVDDDGFLLFPYENRPLPKGLLHSLVAGSARPVLEAALPATPLFNMAFRYNAGRALMMGVRKGGRQPLWVQRMRGAEMLDSLVRHDDHPLIRETRRECLEDYWDLSGVELILNKIRSGGIRVLEMRLDSPSPMSLPLRHRTEAAMVYDYWPTPSGVHVAVQEALERAQMIAPAPEQLAQTSERARLPQSERELHTQLMIEGDMIAGEVDVPIEWLEALAENERAKYIEPGLWIAAEHSEEYKAALVEANMDARTRIVRRLLRYRGAQSREQIAGRYLWTDEETQVVLVTLCGSGSTVEYEGLYYHATLFERAQKETIRMRRRQVRTLPPERYAALLARRVQVPGDRKQALEAALQKLYGLYFPPALWESALLPARVHGYRPELLDALLAEGGVCWRIVPDLGVGFHRYNDIDWDAEPLGIGADLEGNARVVFEALLKRGASFMQRLSGALGGASPYDALMELAERGIAHADSFVPVRQWIDRAKIENAPIRQRVRARVMTLMAGRWELMRPLKELAAHQQLERGFDRSLILSRETAQGLTWQDAVKVLRVWEYTGQVRRGYFIKGLSGMQYIRERDFAGIMSEMEEPDDEIIWLPAVDPAQPWGKYMAHYEGRAFMNLPGTVVALRAGIPVAVFERRGRTLRVFDGEYLGDALRVFAQDYATRRLFPAVRRITVKEYPSEAAAALREAGFSREMQDFVMYRRPS